MTDSPGTQSAASAAAGRAWSNPIRAAWRTLLILGACGLYFIVWRIRALFCRESPALHRLRARWTRRWAASLARCAGIRVTVEGPAPPPGSLIAPNHSGYLDVLALGSALPCFFVAKREVESWPVIAQLFKSSGHIGVSRKRGRGLAGVAGAIAGRLEAGCCVCVFLEGTSSGNDRVLPFHAPLMEPAVRSGAPVVPVGIRWTVTADGADVAEDIAYWKDHVFAPHAWRMLGLRGVSVQVRFGDPIPTYDADRKRLAERSRSAVAQIACLPALPPA